MCEQQRVVFRFIGTKMYALDIHGTCQRIRFCGKFIVRDLFKFTICMFSVMVIKLVRQHSDAGVGALFLVLITIFQYVSWLRKQNDNVVALYF